MNKLVLLLAVVLMMIAVGAMFALFDAFGAAGIVAMSVLYLIGVSILIHNKSINEWIDK